MNRPALLGAALALVLSLGTRPAAAQDEEFAVTDGNRLTDMRDGKKAVREGDGVEVINRSARALVNRIKNPVNIGESTTGRPTPMTDLVRKLGDYVLDMSLPRKISESQKDYIQTYG